MLYNNTNTHTHTHTHTCAYTCTHTHAHMRAHAHGCEKDSLEIVIEQVNVEGSLERRGRMRVQECLRQTVLNRWASIRKPLYCLVTCEHHFFELQILFPQLWSDMLI